MSTGTQLRVLPTDTDLQTPAPTLAFVGTFPPRRCGIATFTSDLVEAVARRSGTASTIVAINDTADGYEYPPRVSFEVNQNILQEYRQAADFLNVARVDAVCVQHEFGIFGGEDGRHVLRLIEQLRMPVVTTLHTIPREPTSSQRSVLEELVRVCDRLVVMTDTGRRFLMERYGVAGESIEVIPHGIPDLPFVDPNFYKDQFGVEGKKVLLTFGLLSPGKGIEHAIRALPAIAEKHPDVVYVVLGATHPHVRKAQGESYRHGLQRLAHECGVDDRITFHDRYVDIQRLCEFLGAADVYVTPYLNEEQITSGTLAYAMGAGKAVVSTPYWHAVEALAEGRGRLVPFRDSSAIAAVVIDLFDHAVERHTMRKTAYTYIRESTWENVAARYVNLLASVINERQRCPRTVFQAWTERNHELRLPAIDLTHLQRLTDDTGLLQHAVFTVPDRAHGYCTDDNARALIVAILARSLLKDDSGVDALIVRYLSFVHHAFDSGAKVFRNFMGFDRRWIENEGSPDSQGRAIWALGVAASDLEDERLRIMAASLFQEALPGLESLRDLRSMALALFGLDAHLRRHGGDSNARRTRSMLADRLMASWRGAMPGPDWFWPEDRLTYANARLPHALIVAGAGAENREMIETGLSSLRWLVDVQTTEGLFSPIGNRGWYPRGGAKALFDQQPVEAEVTVAACIAAFDVTSDRRWIDDALCAFRWFLGVNVLGAPLYDHATGGCRDGLGPTAPNENQGAESTLAWLWAAVQLHRLQARGVVGWTHGAEKTQRTHRPPVSSSEGASA